MHLVYSALQQTDVNHSSNHHHADEISLKAYNAVCEKYEREITAIRKYFPNWSPAFEKNHLKNNRK